MRPTRTTGAILWALLLLAGPAFAQGERPMSNWWGRSSSSDSATSSSGSWLKAPNWNPMQPIKRAAQGTTNAVRSAGRTTASTVSRVVPRKAAEPEPLTGTNTPFGQRSRTASASSSGSNYRWYNPTTWFTPSPPEREQSRSVKDWFKLKRLDP